MEKKESPTPPTTTASNSSTGSSYSIRRRRNPAVLIRWLEEHPYNPYPTKGEKHYLAFYAGMTQRQLNDWFANARRNIKKVGYENWKKKHSGFSAILSGIPLQGPSLAPTLLGSPQFATVGLAAAGHLANCRAPNVPVAAAATTTTCAYPVHGLDGYMNGQSALQPNLSCNAHSSDSALHAPPHFNYGVGIGSGTVAAAGDASGGNRLQTRAHEEQTNGGPQPRDDRARPMHEARQDNTDSFNGNASDTSSYSAVAGTTRRTALDLPTSSLLSLPLNMTLAPSYQRFQQSNGHQPQSNGDSATPASSPAQPPPPAPNPHAHGQQQQPLPATWTFAGTTLLSQVPQVGYGAEWHQLGIKPSIKQEDGSTGNAAEDGGFYDGSPGSLYR